MDPAEFRHAGKLSVADHHRLSGLGTHVDYLVTASHTENCTVSGPGWFSR